MKDDEKITMNLSDFEKVERAGEGSAAEVWKALCKRNLPFASAGDVIALKLYKEDILDEPSQRERIAQEFKTGSRLVHPNLVKIFHADILSPAPYLVMEWCGGQNLFDWRRSVQQPNEQFLIQFATQLLDVLDFLHSSRRVHRDVKPGNINIDPKGKIRLLDYGIIRSLREPGVTPDKGRFVGTYRYSAPEYIFEKEYGYTADLYSFGAVLYYLLFGKEIFAGINRTVDMINAKKEHRITFDRRIKGSAVWAALYELCQTLLQPDPVKRPASAMACVDGLGVTVSMAMPLRVYFACSLTRGDESAKKRAEQRALMAQASGKEREYAIYCPGQHTHPLGAPDLSAPEVYWIDRERVASSDLLLILADDPSFGVGQEAEIAANAGVPIAIFHSVGVDVSRMLRGIAGRITQVSFDGDADLESKFAHFFNESKGRLEFSRSNREREYHLRLGNRVRERREAEKMTVDDLARIAEVSVEQIQSLETRPEQVSNISLVNLRRLARALNVSPAELLRDQSGKDQEFEDLFRASLVNLRSFATEHQLSYAIYRKLRECGREVLRDEIEASAARGADRVSSKGLQEDSWSKLYMGLLNKK